MKTEKLYKDIIKYFSKANRIYFEEVSEGYCKFNLISDGHIIIEAPSGIKEKIIASRGKDDFNAANLKKLYNENQANASEAKYTIFSANLGGTAARIINAKNGLAYIDEKYIKLCGDIYGIKVNNGKSPVFFDAQIKMMALPLCAGKLMDRNEAKKILEEPAC